MHRAKKKKLLSIFLACIISCFVSHPCGASKESGPATRINGLRISVKGKQTRLIFDATGARPKQVGPPSDAGISIFFSQYTSGMQDKEIANAASAVKEIKFRSESGFLEVMFREKDTPVTNRIVEGKKPQSYSLVLEFTAVPRKAAVEQAGDKQEKATSPEIRKVDATDLFGAKLPLNASSLLAEGKKKQDSGSGKAEGEKPEGRPQAFVEGDEQTVALYRTANETFESCNRDLISCGPEVIEAYGEALKAGPNCSLAPLAVYRMGFTAYMMGDYAKAEKSFHYALSQWPDNPVSSRCWIGMGGIFNKKQSYLEAMEAFRAALRLASEKGDKSAAYFELGREFLILGASKDALEMFAQCSSCEPGILYKKAGTDPASGRSRVCTGHV